VDIEGPARLGDVVAVVKERMAAGAA
jgi:hypothetical protein